MPSRGAEGAFRWTRSPFIGSSYNFVGADHDDVAVSIFLVEAKPGRGAPLHMHEYDEIVLVQEGRSRMVIGNDIREATAGDIIVIKARGRRTASSTLVKKP